MLQGTLQGYALLSAILTTLLFGLTLGRHQAFPYTFIVVEIWACRISFCCTPMGAPLSSSHDR